MLKNPLLPPKHTHFPIPLNNNQVRIWIHKISQMLKTPHPKPRESISFSQNGTIISSILPPFWSITKCDFDPHFFLKNVYFRRHIRRMAARYYNSFYGKFMLLGLIAPTRRAKLALRPWGKKWGFLTGFEGKRGLTPKVYAIKWRISRRVTASVGFPNP